MTGPRIILATGRPRRIEPGWVVIDHRRQCFWLHNCRVIQNHSGPRRANQFNLLALLLVRAPGIVAFVEIVEHLYGPDDQGGPDDTHNAIGQVIWEIRRRALDWVLGGRLLFAERRGYAFQFAPGGSP